MTQITNLDPHDPIPSGHHVVVLRRLEEDSPGGIATQIILTGKTEETTHLRNPDGKSVTLDEAIQAATRVAESEGLRRVFVVDRTGGRREAEILRHGGDHSVNMAGLSDTDPVDGVRGSDMRDIAHPKPTTS